MNDLSAITVRQIVPTGKACQVRQIVPTGKACQVRQIVPILSGALE